MITLVKITTRWTRASIFLPHPVSLFMGSLRGGASDAARVYMGPALVPSPGRGSDELFPWQRTSGCAEMSPGQRGHPRILREAVSKVPCVSAAHDQEGGEVPFRLWVRLDAGLVSPAAPGYPGLSWGVISIKPGVSDMQSPVLLLPHC